MTPLPPLAAVTPLTQPIKWHGGKHYLAKRIIALMPPRSENPNAPAPNDTGWIHYVEPYFGGGSVLLEQDPEGISETVNDINGELVNFWRTLQDEGLFNCMARRLEAVPISQEEFLRADDLFTNPLSRACAFFIRARQSRQGLFKSFNTLSKNRTRRGMSEQASAWLTAIEGLPAVHARLRRVVILNDDALKVIKQEDGPRTLFYLDPPYLHETRESTDAYANEMTEQQHAELLLALDKIKGKFILSGYPSRLYDNHAQTRGWHCERIKIDNKSSSKAVKEIKTECLWMNYAPAGSVAFADLAEVKRG